MRLGILGISFVNVKKNKRIGLHAPDLVSFFIKPHQFRLSLYFQGELGNEMNPPACYLYKKWLVSAAFIRIGPLISIFGSLSTVAALIWKANSTITRCSSTPHILNCFLPQCPYHMLSILALHFTESRFRLFKLLLRFQFRVWNGIGSYAFFFFWCSSQ